MLARVLARLVSLARRMLVAVALAGTASAALWAQPAALRPALRAAAADTVPALPRSALAVEADGRWRTWWRSGAAPARWAGELPALARTVRWRSAAPGVEWGELRLAGTGEAWRLRVIVARVDPARVRLTLAHRTRQNGWAGAWAVDSAPAALLALNAGQFSGGQPWGWVVRDGRELQPPGRGPLSMALVVDTAGRARLLPADSIAARRAAGGIAQAFQSYPTLLVGDGVVPPQLLAPGRGVDVGHRDARLAIGELRDGRLLVALTRFEGLGGALDVLPFGPTTPEMAALMGALGARQAVLLDGGLSAQLRLRDGDVPREWPGLRRVPLGLVFEGR